MRRSWMFGALLLAVTALAAPAAAQAGSVSLSPGGTVAAHKDSMVITHYQLTAPPYPLWHRRSTRTCDVDLAGVAHAGPTPDGSPTMEFGSGATSNCSDPADVTFANGPWRLHNGSAVPTNGKIRNVQIQMPVGGVTCDYEIGNPAWAVTGRMPLTPVLVGSTLVTTFDTSWWWVAINPYLYAVPRSATCGAIRIDIDMGSPWEITPGQTITAIP